MNLNGRTINPGELRAPVLLAPRVITTSGGFQQPAPDTAHQVSAWARWQNVHGSEVWQAQAAGANQPATVLIRYNASLNNTWYASNDNGASWYEVVSVDDIENRHEYMELKVQKASAG